MGSVSCVIHPLPHEVGTQELDSSDFETSLYPDIS